MTIMAGVYSRSNEKPCPRICSGSTNSQEMTAVVTRAAPARLSQWRVRTNQDGHLMGGFMRFALGRMNGRWPLQAAPTVKSDS